MGTRFLISTCLIGEFPEVLLLILYTLLYFFMQLSERFSPVARKCAGLLTLVPAYKVEVETMNLRQSLDIFSDDLPNPELIDEEFNHWRLHWKRVNDADVPPSAAQCLKNCDKTIFPNIFILLKLLCSLPTASCECERTFSALCRLNTYNRCTMSENRMSSLALMHIHYAKKVDVDDVIKLFYVKQPRKMHFGNILSD